MTVTTVEDTCPGCNQPLLVVIYDDYVLEQCATCDWEVTYPVEEDSCPEQFSG